MPKVASTYIIQEPIQGTLVRNRQPALLLSDYALLCCLALALFIVVSPEEWALERMPTKHLPVVFGLMALGFMLLGRALFPQVPAVLRHINPITPFIPLLLLTALIILGGGWARFMWGVQNSFLVAGVYCLAAPLAAVILANSSSPQHLLRTYFGLLSATSVAVFGLLAMNYGVRQVYHELEFLFPPLAVLAALSIKSRAGRIAGVAYFLLLAALFKKNTGYLIGLLVACYLTVLYLWPIWQRQKDVLRRAVLVYATAAAAGMVALLIAYLYLNREQYLPSGNPAFRLVTYERAWLRFLDSPLWGNFFTGPAAERFTAFDTGVSNNILPTHSDVLDILAHGGLLGAALWFWAMARVAHTVLHSLKHGTQSALRPYVHTLACMSMGAIVTYAFNPILLQPGKAMLLWSHLGLMVGAALLINKTNSPQK